jgi:tetratricopeptide (TPR) repeat protein
MPAKAFWFSSIEVTLVTLARANVPTRRLLALKTNQNPVISSRIFGRSMAPKLLRTRDSLSIPVSAVTSQCFQTRTLRFAFAHAGLTLRFMLRFRVMAGGAVMLWLALSCGGCIPRDAHVAEEKDPHFQRGRNLVNSQDFKGAVAEFENAVETNPRAAAAHFELGWLYENKLNNYAAAIYHYQLYLQLQPDSDRSHVIDVQERIRGCKQQLANSEFPLPNNQNLQHEVDRLTAENLLLRQQLDGLRSQAAAVAAHPAVTPARVEPAAVVPLAVSISAPIPLPAARGRSHVVKARDTISSIAAQYGVKASAVLAANPRVDPRRLRIGQNLNLP